ncbi:Uncharacterized protein TCM_002472 [Theobroma cacao]|uniref:Uncharacterized protein n=1 Tax=Theobroma cacao TaxID=3641 RepID=A0A061DUD2_THECC|nr:Uncharacterized protein TCM_002472 [Theobroma cacao]
MIFFESAHHTGGTRDILSPRELSEKLAFANSTNNSRHRGHLSPPFYTRFLGSGGGTLHYLARREFFASGRVREVPGRHDLPYTFVEYDKIRAWAKYVNPYVVMPSRNTVVSNVQRIHLREKEKLKQAMAKLENVKTKLYELFEQYASNTCASSTSSRSTSNLPKQARRGTKPKGSKIFSLK